MTVEQVAELLKVDLAAVKATLAPDERTDESNLPVCQVSTLTEGPHKALPIYFTFGAYGQVFAEPLVCAAISTQKPLPNEQHLVDQKVSVTPSILQRMKNVCGATNFSLILRNSEHMMRYIIAGTSESTSSPGCHPAMLRSPLRTAASAVKTGHHRSRRKGGTVGCCLRG